MIFRLSLLSRCATFTLPYRMRGQCAFTTEEGSGWKRTAPKLVQILSHLNPVVKDLNVFDLECFQVLVTDGVLVLPLLALPLLPLGCFHGFLGCSLGLLP
jgi:hypothetical protein